MILLKRILPIAVIFLLIYSVFSVDIYGNSINDQLAKVLLTFGISFLFVLLVFLFKFFYRRHALFQIKKGKFDKHNKFLISDEDVFRYSNYFKEIDTFVKKHQKLEKNDLIAKLKSFGWNSEILHVYFKE